MRIALRNPDSYYSNESIVIPDDDYNFHLVLLKGRQISIQGQTNYVEMIDMCQDKHGRRVIFKMSVLDASILDTDHPSIRTGLVGQFHLNSNGFLKFIKQGPEGPDASDFLKESSSHEFMRNRYTEVLE
jgi:hypothetical protein